MSQSKMIVFEPGLPNTPGWTGLSQTKKEWLQEKTSNIKKFASSEGLAAAQGAVELYDVKQGLKGEAMNLTDYIRTVYGQAERTGWRRLDYVEDLIDKGWPIHVIKAVAERGALLLRGSTGIGLKDLVNVAKELPAPQQDDDKVIDAFIEKKVRDKLREHKAERRAGRSVKLTDEDSAKILFNTGRRIMRATKSLGTSAENRAFIRTVVGWWMEERAIHGTIECKRLAIPDGVVAQVGRPRKRTEENAT